MLHFQNTKVYLTEEVPGDNEEKGKERAQRGERRANEKRSGECRRKKKTSRRGEEEKEKTKTKKAKAAVMAALAAPRPKHDQRAPKKFDETSSDSE